jgi:hypothetical protein
MVYILLMDKFSKLGELYGIVQTNNESTQGDENTLTNQKVQQTNYRNPLHTIHHLKFKNDSLSSYFNSNLKLERDTETKVKHNGNISHRKHYCRITPFQPNRRTLTTKHTHTQI